MSNVRSHTAPNLVSAGNLPKELRIGDPKEFIKAFRASALRLLREARGIAQAEASKKAGISVKDLERLESGKVSPEDLSTLHSLAEMYEVDYPSLLFVFKLAERPHSDEVFKVAAYHDPKIDEETKQAMGEFLAMLKGKI